VERSPLHALDGFTRPVAFFQVGAGGLFPGRCSCLVAVSSCVCSLRVREISCTSTACALPLSVAGAYSCALPLSVAGAYSATTWTRILKSSTG
jgi:hypothetical protein